MKTIKAYTEILSPINGEEVLKHIELCGRVCYKSEDRITPDSAKKFVAGIIKRGHESVLEHYSFTVRFVCDRGVSHELVRHRMASYCQESTRYCNYSKEKFDGGLTFILPCWFSEEAGIRMLGQGTVWMDTSDTLSQEERLWYDLMFESECGYKDLISLGWSPQQARSVLPSSLKTEVVMTANLREWRHFFKLRTAKASHPQMREVAILLLEQLKAEIPVVFDDIEVCI